MAPAVTPTLLNGLLDIQFSDHNDSANVADGVRLNIGGLLTLDAANETDAAAKADGSSVGAAALGVGVGVAINNAVEQVKPIAVGGTGPGTTAVAASSVATARRRARISGANEWKAASTHRR